MSQPIFDFVIQINNGLFYYRVKVNKILLPAQKHYDTRDEAIKAARNAMQRLKRKNNASK